MGSQGSEPGEGEVRVGKKTEIFQVMELKEMREKRHQISKQML